VYRIPLAAEEGVREVVIVVRETVVVAVEEAAEVELERAAEGVESKQTLLTHHEATIVVEAWCHQHAIRGGVRGESIGHVQA
jgi:hypothetical protein